MTSHSNLIFRGPRVELLHNSLFTPYWTYNSSLIDRCTNDKLVKCKKEGANCEVILLIWKKNMMAFFLSNVFQNPNETASADVWKGKKWMRLTWHHFWCVWKAALEKPGSSDDIAKWICLLYPTNTHSSYLVCSLGKSLFFGPTHTFLCPLTKEKRHKKLNLMSNLLIIYFSQTI